MTREIAIRHFVERLTTKGEFAKHCDIGLVRR